MNRKRTSVEALESLRLRLLRHQRRDPETGCLIFTGYTRSSGYGELGLGGNETVFAHRAAAFFSGIIDSLDDPSLVCHHCDNPPCIEPSHLYKGSNATNRADALARKRWIGHQARQTRCKHGHALSGDNMYRLPNGERRCRSCERRRGMEYKKRRRERAL